jgi:hypothetical protein
MGIRIGDGDGDKYGGTEELELFGKSDTVTVNSIPHMSPSVSSSSASAKMSYGFNEEEFEWVAVDKEIDLVTDKAPELDEVDDAFSALQLMFNDDDDEESGDQLSESEFVDWIEPSLQLCNTSLLQPFMLDRLYDAFHVFQTDPSVQVLSFLAVLRSMV